MAPPVESREIVDGCQPVAEIWRTFTVVLLTTTDTDIAYVLG